MAGNLTAMIASIFSGGVTADPYYKYTTLLLPGNGTNGAQNNTFLDSSTNNFTITRNGNTSQGTFSPFSQTGWGNYFDGSGDYLSYGSNAIFGFGTADFTVEAWVYIAASADFNIFNVGGAAAGSYGLYWVGSASKFESVRYGDPAGSGRTTNTYGIGQWYHIAASRSGGTARLFINGNIDAGATYAMGSVTATAAETGRTWQGSALNNGYISNLRVITGTALYTANFTPPTAPLTAISGTSLLTCQSNRFRDASTNNFTITPNGSPSVQAFSPFNPTASWSAATYGGSGYFDGSGDYLTAASSASFDVWGGNFTWECFFYPTGNLSNSLLFAWGTTSGTYISVGFFNNINIYSTVSGTNPISGTAPILNAWNHIAISKSGSTFALFVNGIRLGTSTSTSYPTGNQPVILGSNNSGGQSISGYVTDARLVKGTAVYDPTVSTLTVPTAPLTAITNTSLLLNFTNAGIYDATSKNDLETVGNAQISTTQSKWGGSSMSFDGSGDYLLGPAAKVNDFGTGDFTIEAWIYFSSVANGQIASAGGGPVSGAYYWQYYTSQLQFGANTSPGQLIAANWSPSSGVWYHVAVTRSGTTLRQFVNGTQLGTNATSSHSFVDASTQIGYGGAGYFNGYMQDFRVTKGYARYTANFTPPTAAFPTL